MDYRPLDTDRIEIRLLSLLPGNNDSIVRCSLEHASLISPPEFCALSYCWGDPSITTEIIINDTSVQVTTNLESALRHLRAKELYTLWVDAVCINQGDKAEKTQQLLWMGAIYRQAQAVHAWVGEEGDDFNRAFRPSTEHDQTHDKDDERSAALVEFLSRPYWMRVWIIQELALSQMTIIHCGPHNLDWEKLANAVLQIDDPASSTAPVVNFEGLERFLANSKNLKPMRLLEALWNSRSAASTEPRDKVFALLGLVYDSALYLPIPNYNQSLRDLCSSMTLSAIAITRRLDILPFLSVGVYNHNSPGLPSWASNWFAIGDDKERAIKCLNDHDKLREVKSLFALTAHQRLPKFEPEGANFQCVPIWAHDSRGSVSMMSDILRVRGIIFDDIDGTCPTPSDFERCPIIPAHHQSTSQANAYGSNNNLWTHIAKTFLRYPNRSIWATSDPSEYPDLYLDLGLELLALYTNSTLDSDFGSELLNIYMDIKYFEEVQATLGCTKRGKVLHWLRCSASFLVSGRSLEELLINYRGIKPKIAIPRPIFNHLVEDMRFMTTAKGYIGWAHTAARRGDKIVLLEGSQTPVILREREGGGFFMIGDAGVDVGMHSTVRHVFGTEKLVWSQLEIH